MLKALVLAVVAVVLIVGAALAVFVVAGSESDDPEETARVTPTAVAGAPPATELTAEDVLERAAARSAEVETFHFVLTHEGGTTPLPLGLELQTAEGDVVVPDRLAADVNARAAGLNVNVQVIGVEGRTWVTNPFTRQWQSLGNTNIRDFADPNALISGVLPAIENPSLEDGGRVDGMQTHLVTGTIDSAVLEDSLGIAEPGRDVEVEVWIGVDDDLPRRVRLIGALSDAEAAGVVRQVELSRFDEPVEIMPPE